MPRLGHKKSRNGCRQCKARHVKCDELKPCTSCARHGVQCSLMEWDPDAPPPVPVLPEASRTPRSTTMTTERSQKTSTNTPTSASSQSEFVPGSASNTTPGSTDSSPNSSNDNYPFLTKFVQRSENTEPNYWVRDLVLMHNWTTEAYSTISFREDIRDCWRLTAPREATQSLYLMHELLAFSAFHMAYFDAEQRKGLYALGIYHQDLTIRSLRKVLPTLCFDNASPLFATSTLMTLSVFGSTGLDAKYILTRPRSAIVDLLDIFALHQGVAGILSNYYAHCGKGPFGPLLRQIEQQVAPQPLHDQLLQQISTLVSYFEVKFLAPEIRSEILSALESLKNVLSWAAQPFMDNKELRVLFFWPVRFSANFLAMLRQQDPGALVTIAYYTVALRAAEPIYWFIEGWAERVIRDVAQTLDESWHDVLQWPWNIVIGSQPLPDAVQQAQERLQATAISEAQPFTAQHPRSLQAPADGVDERYHAEQNASQQVPQPLPPQEQITN